MIPLLPKWNLHGNRPTFYDADAVTMLELASTLHGSMNALIDDYNKFVDNVNKTITEFIDTTEKDQEVFQVAIRQEFQDFINVIELNIANQNNKINDMVANQVQITQGIINEAIQAGGLEIYESYDEATESLNLVVTGEV